jgi:hypothetical protein
VTQRCSEEWLSNSVYDHNSWVRIQCKSRVNFRCKSTALLGHKVDDITTHYSAPDLAHLLECAERACDEKRGTVLRVCMQYGGKNGGKMRRVPATAASR